MEKVRKKQTGFYPTPSALVSKLIADYLKQNVEMPSSLVEPAAGEGHFIIETWATFILNNNLSKKQSEKMIETTILFENDKAIFQILKKKIDNWCSSKNLNSRPNILHANFLLHGTKYLGNIGDNALVVGNPPWDEFTTRKHDGAIDLIDSRKERMSEKRKYQALGFKNVYQSFLHEILKLDSKNLKIIFVLPRQLLGDLSAQSLRKRLIASGSLDLTVYSNKDEPAFYFASVARTAEILCLEYNRSNKPKVRIRRGFEDKFVRTSPYGSDSTLPCPFKSGTESILQHILANSSLSQWDFDMEVTVSRGKVDYTDVNYKLATNGRTMSAYQFEQGKSTDVILNKILPDSKRKLKAAILKSKDSISDSMLRIRCKNEKAHPYLMLLLNSRPIELALRAVISNINLNNFRLMSLPIPQPTERTLAKAKRLCDDCAAGKFSWEKASDELSRDIYQLSQKQLEPLRDLFPDRQPGKLVA